MLYVEIIAVCYEIHKNYVNIFCAQNEGSLNVKDGSTQSSWYAIKDPTNKSVVLRVKRDKPTRCNLSDVYYQTCISTCFGHHYAHHQENKTVYFCIWCSALVVLAVVVYSWVVSCVHCVKVTVLPNSAEHHTQKYTVLIS